jgi:hypothetical protein
MLREETPTPMMPYHMIKVKIFLLRHQNRREVANRPVINLRFTVVFGTYFEG